MPRTSQDKITALLEEQAKLRKLELIVDQSNSSQVGFYYRFARSGSIDPLFTAKVTFTPTFVNLKWSAPDGRGSERGRIGHYAPSERDISAGEAVETMLSDLDAVLEAASV